MSRLSFALCLMLATGCSTVTPGTVALRVWVSAEDEASRYEVIRGGRYWAHPNADVYLLPTTEQRVVWTESITEGSPIDESITFAGRDGQAVNVDIGIGYQLDEADDAVVTMVRRYGPNLDDVIDGRVRDSVRNALNLCAATASVEQIYGEFKGPLMECVGQRLEAEYAPNGLHIVRVTLNSEVRLPEKVTRALEASIAASQDADRTRREVEQTRAEGEKTVAKAMADAEAERVRAETQASSNRVVAESITPGLLELERLRVAALYAEKWDGKLPETTLGGDVPLIFDLDAPRD